MSPGTDRDPLTILMAPPPDETPEQRAARLEEERLLQARNLEIEEMLRIEKMSLNNRKCVRVLLVGQSESGKSTVLKNFQLAWSPRAFRAERATWTRIIYLNIVRAINVICNAVLSELNRTENISSSGHSLRTPSLASINTSITALGKRKEGTPPPPPTADRDRLMAPRLAEYHQDLIEELSSLRDLELQLQNQLAGIPPNGGLDEQRPQSQSSKEFFVHSGKESTWRRTWTVRRTSFEQPLNGSQDDVGLDGEGAQIQDNKNVMNSLFATLDAMKRLWADDQVRQLRVARRVRLEDSAPFYLDNLDRIIAMGYVPSDDDIVRARLRTIGVQEHFLTHEQRIPTGLGREVSREWIIYDVGGARSQRQAWVPFFEHMNAIIFLAPVNCFNQKLVEDPKINRLEDSFHLYEKVVGSRLLGRIPVILFLNKMDLLAHNIENGIQLSRFVTSYGDRPNTVESIVDYFQKKFRDICRQHSPTPRRFYAYRTSAIDISSTTVTLNIVRDGILKAQLRNAELV